MDVSLVERWRIPGGIDGQSFGRIVSVAGGDSGRVFLLDGEFSRVYVVDDGTGKLIDSFGKEGEGPGDLRHAQYAFVAGPDRLDIVSLMPPSIQSLTFVGDYLDSRRLGFSGHFVLVWLSRATRMGDGYVVSGTSADAGMNQDLFIGAATDDMVLSSTFVSRTVAKHGTMRLQDLTFDQPRWDTDGSNLFISSAYPEYRIDVYSFDGSLQRRLRRSYKHLPRSDGEIQYLKDSFREARNKTGGTIDTSVDPFYRDIDDLYVLPDGNLLVLTSRRARATAGASLGEFDVLDAATGALKRRVRFLGEGNALFDNYVVCGWRLFVVTDMKPPTWHAGRDRDRDVPYMSVICYELRDTP